MAKTAENDTGEKEQLDLLGALTSGTKKPVPAPIAVPVTTPARGKSIDVASSEAFPLQLHPVPGVEGLSMAMLPGQVGVSSAGVRHARSLDADLERLAGVALVVDLTTPEERGLLGAVKWHERARAAGIEVHAAPTESEKAMSEDAVITAVDLVDARLGAGARVVIVSREGLGRAGMLAACVMVRCGRSADEAIEALRQARGRTACETDAQVAAVRALEASATSEAEDEDEDEEGDDDAPFRDEDAPLEEAEDETPPDDADEASEGPAIAVPRIRAASPRTSMNLGCVLGAAIGDAMGHPTEFLSMAEIRRRWGATGVSGFELWWDRGGARFAPYTDDTQMAEVVLRSLLASRESDEELDAAMQRMARGFVEWSNAPQGGHRAPGNACLSGCRALARGVAWNQAGGSTAGGCGSVMRAYPFGLVFSSDVARAERWAVAHSKLTHRDPIALAASAAMAVGIARIVRGETDREVLSEMVAAACRYSASTAQMMSQALDEAWKGVAPDVTLDRLRGWAAHEAIAAAVYVMARHGDDARAAILEGANTPGDSDSIATLAGALVGTRVGVEGLDAAWIRDVERATELGALAETI